MRSNDEIVTIIEDKMKEDGLSLSELARRVGMAKSAISRYFNRTREFPLNRINEFSNVLDLDPKYILGFEDQSDIQELYDKLTPPRQREVYTFAQHQLDEQNNGVEESSAIYLVGQTAAGEPLEYSQINAEQINTTVPSGADYALTVKGDSMEPLIKDGSIIFYKEQPTVENGEIAIVELNNNEVTCKKFYYNGENVVLKSINVKYDDIIVSEDVRIIGKVII
ncbi:LexA family protein [Facklamia hominis]|uniref:LexA family protein n=1 Tax=Facklamia hominis TaxID=178214 RepID=UPI00101DC7FB|nr:XRE family transcriptional regulator [Facklamia hominis]RYC97898.1 XRE family transcriptional regulator [Facklamia hominis]